MPATATRKPAKKAGRSKYRYDPKSGGVVEVLTHFDARRGKMVETIVPQKKSRSRIKEWLQPRGKMRSRNVAQWPMVSNNLSFHPKQVKDVRRICKSKGVNIEFDFTHGVARTKFSDPKNRREVCRALGRADFDAGYSDPAPLRYDGNPNDL